MFVADIICLIIFLLCSAICSAACRQCSQFCSDHARFFDPPPKNVCTQKIWAHNLLKPISHGLTRILKNFRNSQIQIKPMQSAKKPKSCVAAKKSEFFSSSHHNSIVGNLSTKLTNNINFFTTYSFHLYANIFNNFFCFFNNFFRFFLFFLSIFLFSLPRRFFRFRSSPTGMWT